MPCRRPFVCAAAFALLSCTAAFGADEAAEIRALITRADLPAALERAERAVAAKPKDASLRFMRAVVLMDMQRDPEALMQFAELSQEYPELPDPYNNIALLLARAGRLNEALQALQAALRNDPGHRTARANLGQVHLMLAVQAWEQASAGAGVQDANLLRRLEGARALLAPPARAAR
jgi:Flp pilus assembly protein TadD